MKGLSNQKALNQCNRSAALLLICHLYFSISNSTDQQAALYSIHVKCHISWDQIWGEIMMIFFLWGVPVLPGSQNSHLKGSKFRHQKVSLMHAVCCGVLVVQVKHLWWLNFLLSIWIPINKEEVAHLGSTDPVGWKGEGKEKGPQ